MVSPVVGLWGEDTALPLSMVMISSMVPVVLALVVLPRGESAER
ncbi:hypothetical protein [Nocardia vermiculata]|nr:hypothetical protein [Nocardia vermiculata]